MHGDALTMGRVKDTACVTVDGDLSRPLRHLGLSGYTYLVVNNTRVK